MPRVGDIVNYVLPTGPNSGEIRPAIVVRVWNEHSVNLQVFIDSSNDGYAYSRSVVWVTNVPYSEDVVPGTWHPAE